MIYVYVLAMGIMLQVNVNDSSAYDEICILQNAAITGREEETWK